MRSLYGETIFGPTNFKCRCGGELYVEMGSFGVESLPNNFYCVDCREHSIVDDDTLMEEYFKAIYSNKAIAERNFEKWKQEQRKMYRKRKLF